MSKPQRFVAGQFILLGIFAVALVVFPPGQYAVGRSVAQVLIVVAFAVLMLAVREFAVRNRRIPNITPTPNRATELVDTGVYGYIRHPIYTSVLMGSIGVALAHGHFAVMIVALGLVVFFTIKSRFEESLLRAAYPQYAAYMTRTGRFLPYL